MFQSISHQFHYGPIICFSKDYTGFAVVRITGLIKSDHSDFIDKRTRSC